MADDASLYEAVEKIKENGGRFDIYVNGDSTESYTTSDGQLVPSIQKFLGDQADNIQELEQTAIDARDQAANSAIEAQESAANALMFAEDAEISANAAAINARIYPNTTAGLAATTNGQYFSVPSAVNNEYLILYLNNSGAAVEIKRYLNPGDVLQNITNVNYSFVITDNDLKIALGIKTDGTLEASLFEATSANLEELSFNDNDNSLIAQQDLNRFSFAVTDGDNKVAFGISLNGEVSVKKLSVQELSAETIDGITSESLVPRGRFTHEINGFISYGQSLSLGFNASPALSTTQRFDNLKFNGSVITNGSDPVVIHANLSPLTEVSVETPVSGATDCVKELILSEEGLSFSQQNYQLLGSAPGQNGFTVAQLSKGTVPYGKLIDDVSYGYSLSQAASKTYGLQAVMWSQGEANYSSPTASATYKTAVKQLRTDIQTDAFAITGQIGNLPLIEYQTATHKFYSRTYPNIALAQLELTDEDANIYMACPTYQFTYPDNLHVTNSDSKILGAYYGLVYKRVVIDKLPWKPLRPKSFVRQGALLNVEFDVPVPPLVLDISNVVLNTNYGFNIFDPTSVEIPITSVSLSGPSTVKIVASSSIPAGSKLQYAFYGSGTAGRTNGPRGNLRDSQGNEIVFGGDGLNTPLHNWCVMFELTIN